jgi:hypothetical protein
MICIFLDVRTIYRPFKSDIIQYFRNLHFYFIRFVNILALINFIENGTC